MPSFSVSNILTKAEVSRSAELEDAISKYLTKSRGDDQWVDDASSVFMETTFGREPNKRGSRKEHHTCPATPNKKGVTDARQSPCT